MPLPINAHNANATAEDLRSHGRLKTQEATCSLGRVVDISASGLKVRRSGKQKVSPGDTLNLDLQVASLTTSFPVRVVWVSKSGFFNTDIGLMFDDLSDQQRSELVTIAKMVMSESQLMPLGG